MTKYCQEQAKYSKDKAKEMAELKQWVSTAETKMKSSEQEKACLLKEIEELRKLTKRFGREPSCESTIDKIFGGTEIDNSEASSDTTISRRVGFLMNTCKGNVPSPFLNARAKLEQMTKYCQEQAKYSKDKAKEMAELKQWVSTAETKMKSSEQEKACLLKEIEELRKLTKRFGREPSCESTIDKIFGGTEIDNSEASSDTSISRRVGFLMNTCKGNVPSPFLNAVSSMFPFSFISLRLWYSTD
ncbi:unnamed protein product [Nippostrongylus brasiliensis]|uniref:CPG4 domain-containing protein n=1 Tax=Nippostrongylus brasiliensis TaxID=27835 RepID=A0A0N4YXS9_NIPBR|nr:unnamed protein product [Nippostrongylus brasiliensis]